MRLLRLPVAFASHSINSNAMDAEWPGSRGSNPSGSSRFGAFPVTSPHVVGLAFARGTIGPARRTLLLLPSWSVRSLERAKGNPLASFHAPEGTTAAQIDMHRQFLISQTSEQRARLFELDLETNLPLEVDLGRDDIRSGIGCGNAALPFVWPVPRESSPARQH